MLINSVKKGFMTKNNVIKSIFLYLFCTKEGKTA